MNTFQLMNNLQTSCWLVDDYQIIFDLPSLKNTFHIALTLCRFQKTLPVQPDFVEVLAQSLPYFIRSAEQVDSVRAFRNIHQMIFAIPFRMA
jgi:hypothetical protein